MSIITAHSGCEGTERDSLESIERALAAGVEAIEIDVRLSPAGELRVSHNALSAEEYETRPLVRDAFARIADTGLMVNCDLKEEKALYPLLQLAKEYGLDKSRLILTGCASIETLVREPDLTSLAQVFLNHEEIAKYYFLAKLGKDILPRLRTVLDTPRTIIAEHAELVDEELDSFLIAWCLELGVAGFNHNYRAVTPAFIDACKEAGVNLSVWTVDDAEASKLFFEKDIFNVTTRRPVALTEVRKNTAASR